jgi:CheY-like chemotaxis protein
MKILLVEDEAGIRAGLTSFLQMRGHEVRAAASCREGLQWLEVEDFDVVVTDWRLGDDVGPVIVTRAKCPTLVMSGFVGEVDTGAARVMAKPVPPAELLAEIEKLASRRAAPAAADRLETLPCDTRDRLRLALALVGDAAAGTVVDDGEFVTLRVPGVDTADVELLARLELLGGDLRLLSDGDTRLELRLYRDGRPDGIEHTVSPAGAWPPVPAPIAIDFDGHACAPTAFLDLVRRARDSREAGRTVEFLNVPSHLRFLLEVSAQAHDLPMRAMSGPRIPEVLADLWR